jgi:predicted nucleotidyltransferase
MTQLLSVSQAFDKFQRRLQTTSGENTSAKNRQLKLRRELDATFDITSDFLTGSYARETKTKPLRDVDIMIVLSDTSYLDRHPRDVLDDVCGALRPIYGDHRVEPDRRAVRVDFGVTLVDNISGDVMSFDVVPAFADGENYLIPDDVLGEWISTNPRVHADRARAANAEYFEQWKPLVKVFKTWNNHQGTPIEPSFLLEVMALDILRGTWGGSRRMEIREFFATAQDRVSEPWPDPAGLGPDVSDSLHGSPTALAGAIGALADAEKASTEAMRLERAGRVGDALDAWQALFGPTFAKS